MARSAQTPVINGSRCSGCGRCIAVCHLPMFSFETYAWKKTAVFDETAGACNGCGKCEARCPVGAITMHKKKGQSLPIGLGDCGGAGGILHHYRSSG